MNRLFGDKYNVKRLAPGQVLRLADGLILLSGAQAGPLGTPLLQIDDGKLLNQLAVWAPDAAIRQKILVTNPARLYGFDQA